MHRTHRSVYGGRKVWQQLRRERVDAMRYTNELEEAGSAPSVGSRGDAYNNALADSVLGLFKTEEMDRRRSWPSLKAVECSFSRMNPGSSASAVCAACAGGVHVPR